MGAEVDVFVTHPDPHQFRGQPVSAAVAATVADAEDIDVAELSPPLYDAIDTDALNELIATTDRTTRVSFAYHGHEITVRGDRHISIDAHCE